MKKFTVLGHILFWLTVSSPLVSFALASIVGEANVFGVAGIVRYSWLMWCFVSIGIASILIGVCLKNRNLKYKKNLIVAFVCLPLLIIFGSYRFIFTNISYDVNKVVFVENKTALEFPNSIKIATTEWDNYDVSYAKITKEESKEMFEKELANNSLWQKSISPEIKGLLPVDIQYETVAFDYFIFCNITTKEFNKAPNEGTCNTVFIAYDIDLQRLLIVDDYEITISPAGRSFRAACFLYTKATR